MPGPQPLPGALKVLRGNPSGRPIPKEPKVPRGFPAPPKDLEPEAAAKWRAIGKAYAEAGIVTTLDVDTFANFCRVAVKLNEASKQLAREALVVPTYRLDKEGNAVLVDYTRNPLDIVARDAAQTMRMYARELGLTPASRVGLGRVEEEPGDALDSWKAAK